MIARLLRAAYIIILLSVTGCADLASLLATPTLAPAPLTTATPQPLPSATNTQASQPEAQVLRIWLPPRFDPALESAAARLLRQRLSEFEAAHPGLQIEIRVKAEAGDASLLNSLAVTSLAAPSALPDLIALTRADLESAASSSLLHPMDGLSTLLDSPNWYPYARELGHFQNIGYGLPFAGNALVLVRPVNLEVKSWDDLYQFGQPIAFPAGDPQALFPLYLYLSTGARINDDQGQPTLVEGPLAQTLTLLQTGLQANVYSPTLLEMDSYRAAYQEFQTARAGAAITWSVDYLSERVGSMQNIPGVETSRTFADGWIWALAGSSSENQQLATELAEFLMDDGFLPVWTREAGYLPTQVTQAADVNAILESAQVLPPQTTLEVLGPIMNQAVSRVLNGEQVNVVVRSVMDQIK